jgi:hypothetical protein
VEEEQVIRRLLMLTATLIVLAGPVLAAEALTADEPAMAAAPSEVSPAWMSEFEFLLAKAVTYEVGTSLLEVGMLVAFFGGGASAAGGAFLAVLASTSAVYIAHEYAWEAAMPPSLERDDARLVASKSVTYRIVDTLRAITLGAAFGGAHATASALYAATLTVAELGLYAANEVAFLRLRRFVLTED